MLVTQATTEYRCSTVLDDEVVKLLYTLFFCVCVLITSYMCVTAVQTQLPSIQPQSAFPACSRQRLGMRLATISIILYTSQCHSQQFHCASLPYPVFHNGILFYYNVLCVQVAIQHYCSNQILGFGSNQCNLETQERVQKNQGETDKRIIKLYKPRHESGVYIQLIQSSNNRTMTCSTLL